MKRLCIYVTYDTENVVDHYIGYMLKELRKWVDSLVVVCNYREIVRGMENVRPYADRIYYRENIGFDAGAYKDVLCKYLGWDIARRFDEILLVNDSFYGPLYALGSSLEAMEKGGADFWGLTRAPAGVLHNGYAYDSHIQSYFMGFGKELVNSRCFKNFWEEMRYPETLHQAVVQFELGCSRYLSEHGFRSAALTDGYRFCESEIPYMTHANELIRDIKIPVLKRTSLYLTNKGFENALKAVRYIKDTGIYDVAQIKEHCVRISSSRNRLSMIDFGRLQHFLKNHSRIYFYGAGVYGRNLARLFEYMGWSFTGFLVSSADNQLPDCTAFDNVDLDEKDGIIITVGNKDMLDDILKVVKKRCADEQILYPDM